MKHAIAIAVAKVKKRLHTATCRRNDSVDVELEVSRTGLSILLITGALIGFGALLCLIIGLIRSGPLALVHGLLSALFGG